MADSRALSIVLKARDEASRTLDKFTKSTGSKFSKLGGAALKLGVAFGGLMVVKEVGGFLIDCAKAAEEDARAQAVLNKVVVNATGASKEQLDALDKYILKTAIATGITDDAIRSAYTPLIAAAKDTTKAQKYLAIAMDVSTARGLDLTSVATALAKAENGNMTALKKLGVQTKDASGKSLTLAQILGKLQDAYGGATAEASKNNVWAQLSVIFQETKEAIGAALLPKLRELGNWVANNPQAIADGLSSIAGAFANIVDWVSATLSSVQGFFAWLAGNTQPGGGGTTTPGYNAAAGAATGAKWLEDNPNAPASQRAKVQAYVDAYNYTPLSGDPTKTRQSRTGGGKGKVGTYALGGVVPGRGAVPAIVHGGEPILPYNNPSRAWSILASSEVGRQMASALGGSSNVAVPVVINLNGREVGRALATTTIALGRGGVA